MDKHKVTTVVGTEKILKVIGPAALVMFMVFSQVTGNEVGSAFMNNLEVIRVGHKDEVMMVMEGTREDREVDKSYHAQVAGSEQQDCLC